MVAVSASTSSRARPAAKRTAAKRAPANRASAAKKVVPANPAPYRVRPGQSWDNVAKYHNTTSAKLKELNPGIADLKAGMRVKVK